MYRTYITEKPPRPHLGLIMSAGSLALTLIAAYGLMQLRTGTVELGKPVRPPGWPFAFSAPSDWWSANEETGPRSQEQSRWRDMISLAPRNGGPHRSTLTIFHYQTYPSLALDFLVDQIARQVLGVEDSKPLSIKPFPVGPLLGVRAELREAELDGWRTYLVALACLPNGRAIGAVVTTSGVAGRFDYNLLSEVCASIQPTKAFLRGDPPSSLPLRFTPPPHACFGGEESKADFGTRLAAGAEAEFAWRLDVQPTFLLPDRAPADLLRDYLVNSELRPTPSAAIEERTDRGRRMAVARLTNNQAASDLRVVELSPQRAAFVFGYAAERDAEPLAALCGRLAAEIEAGPSIWPFDVDAARQRGAELMNELRRGPLDRWLPRRQVRLGYVRERQDLDLISEQVTIEPPSPESAAYSGEMILTMGRTRRPDLNIDSRWDLDPHGLALRASDRIQVVRDGVPYEMTLELRTAGPWSELKLSLTDGAGPRDVVLQAGPEFLPDMLIWPVCAALGKRGGAADGLFRVTSLDLGSLTAEFIRPLALGDDAPEGAAGGVIIRRDSDPRGWISYFDSSGALLKTVHADGSVTRRRAGGASSGGNNLLRRLLGGS